MHNWVLFVWLCICFIYFTFDLVLSYRFESIKATTSLQQKGISVIIAARNEEDNLRKNLYSILNQDHQNFEVIVVDDNSKDDTLNIIRSLQKQYTNLKYIAVKSSYPSKKNALTRGISISKYETLCFSDADCSPQTPKWLTTMQNQISPEAPIVLGFSPYSKSKGILNQLIRFETTQTAINYFSFAQMGIPYMGVGRNLMYTKTVFKNLNGFKSHNHISSGDDDLFVNSATTLHNVEVCTLPESFVESIPKKTFKSWIAQKQRHITTAPHYKTSIQALLSLQFLVRFLFWYGALICIALIEFEWVWKLFSILVLCSLVEFKSILQKTSFEKLESKDLVLKAPFLEFILINFQVYFFFSNFCVKNKEWKP